MSCFGLAACERSLLRSLSTPAKIQCFLDEEIAYNKEKDGETCRSPRRVLRERRAHCFEGALLAAAALRFQGHPPVVMQLEAVRDDDHVIALFRRGCFWGAAGKSNFAGLRFREPVYRSLRELVMSYFEHYFNLEQEKTLRAYTRPVDLTRFDARCWMTAEEDLWDISDLLAHAPRTTLLTEPAVRRLNLVDDRLFRAGCVGMVR